jgi:hypothetical protein
MAVQPDVEYFARLVDALEPWLVDAAARFRRARDS